MNWVYHDGGRKAAGYTGRDKSSRDCVARAIAIATGKPYQEVFMALNGTRDELLATTRHSAAKRGMAKSHARTGVTKRIWQKYLADLGWTWHPTMQIGSGCRVHLRSEELPGGTLIVRCSRHLVAMIDGVVYDTYDPTRLGTRCVYGYYTHE